MSGSLKGSAPVELVATSATRQGASSARSRSQSQLRGARLRSSIPRSSALLSTRARPAFHCALSTPKLEPNCQPLLWSMLTFVSGRFYSSLGSALQSSGPDPPPLRWSILKYGLQAEGGSRNELRLGFIPRCGEVISAGIEIGHFSSGLVTLCHELTLTDLQFGHLLLELLLGCRRRSGGVDEGAPTNQREKTHCEAEYLEHGHVPRHPSLTHPSALQNRQLSLGRTNDRGTTMSGESKRSEVKRPQSGSEPQASDGAYDLLDNPHAENPAENSLSAPRGNGPI